MNTIALLQYFKASKSLLHTADFQLYYNPSVVAPDLTPTGRAALQERGERKQA